jgi:hypothetical protein
MGKITIEFDSVEESQDARVALDAMKWKMSMWDLDQLLRGTTKHGVSMLDKSKEATDEEFAVAEKIRNEIRNILNDYNLNLES